MRVKRSICTALAALLYAASPALADTTGTSPPDPIGEWLVAKGYARIRIVDCENQLWGVVAWEASPGGTDMKNPDVNKRTRPTLGMPVLLGMTRSKTNQWKGEIYNSQDGHTYSANISLVDPDTLRVQGCFLAILCGGENWTRVQPPTAPGASQAPNSRSTKSQSLEPTESPPQYLTETNDAVCSRIVGSPRLSH